MAPKFSISTVWNARSASDAASMVKELKGMGFDRIELNFTLTSRDIYDIISLKEREGIEITSLHNFCPIPEGLTPDEASPDYYSLSSLDEDERKKAMDATKITIETARKLGAAVVILHLGYVSVKDKTRRLARHLGNKDNYGRIIRLMREERQGLAARHFEKTHLSVEELLRSAKAEDIILGIENRYYYREIPSLDEIGVLLDRFDDDHVGYWHDAGHAQIFQNLRLLEHKDYLDRYASRLVGIHLHDITGMDDHLAPLQGDFDFSVLRPYIKKDIPLVLEIHYPEATADDIKRGVNHLAKLFGETE